MSKEKENEKVKKKESGNGAVGDSIFDEAFRKMMEGMPPLVISLVNEMFGTDYPEDEEVLQLRNEHHEVNGTLITDALVEIRGRLFHIECQSSKDGTMSLRMIEYDLAIALERAKKGSDGRYHVHLPDSCVLYIRNHRSVPKYHEVVVETPDGRELTYRAKTMQARDYSADQIIEKNLHILAPYHVLRHEAFVKSGRKDEKKLEELVNDMSKIVGSLEALAAKHPNRMTMYSDLIFLIWGIADYVIPEEGEVREKVGDIMKKGRIKLSADYIQEGKAEGWREGNAEGIVEGKTEGKFEQANVSYQRCLTLGMSKEDALYASGLKDLQIIGKKMAIV